jgi:hypothetical protein
MTMARRLVTNIALLVFISIGVGACDQAGSVSNSIVPSSISEGGLETITPSDSIETPDDGDTDLEGQAIEVAEKVNECLVCHTDKDKLIDTAKPEEEVIHESEGEG